MRHSANLDILRSLAVSAVLGDHLIATLVAHTGFGSQSLVPYGYSMGQAGVLAFFVHTSLVLMYSLERMSSSSGQVTLHFYVRRFFRIYPLSVFCVTLALILHVPDVTWRLPDPVTPQMIVSNLLLAQNIFGKGSVLAPLWSLPFEVQMYLALPALYFLTLRKWAIGYLLCLFAIFGGLATVFHSVTGGHLEIIEYVPCFISGVLCYALRNRVRAVLPAALWAPFVLLLGFGSILLRNGAHPKGSFLTSWIFCLILGLAINVFHDSASKPLNTVAEKIAQYSYGVYLVHIPVIYLVFLVLGVKSALFGTILVLTITALASVVTYHFIELPFINLGRKLSSPRPVSSSWTMSAENPSLVLASGQLFPPKDAEPFARVSAADPRPPRDAGPHEVPPRERG